MKLSFTIVRRVAVTFAVAATLGVLGAGPATADPQSHLVVHQPEILAGIVPQPEGRPAPRPEILGGITSSRSVQVDAAARPSTPATSGGFDWADAGIGAAVALAGAALASGGALALRKRVSLAH